MLKPTDRACLSIRNSAIASWEIARASAEDEGLYECIAQSSAGQGRALTELTVRGLSHTHNANTHTHTPPQMFCLHTSQSQRDFEISARHFFFFYLWFMAKTSTWYKACQQKHFLHCLFTADNSSLMFPLKQSLLQSWSGQWTWLPLWEAWRCSPARLKAPCGITWPGAERVILSEPVRGGSRCFRTHPCRSVGCGLRMLGRTTVWPLTPTETAESPCGFSSQVR